MFSAKDLTPEQVETLKRLAAQGSSLSDLQRHLKDEQNISVTYMDIRFAVLDLGIEILEDKQEDAPKPEELQEAIEPEQATGLVSATIDNITLPGAMVSGKVTFSDGETAIWMIDQTGRPGLDPDTPGYRPSEEDLVEFQTQLKTLLQKQQGGL